MTVCIDSAPFELPFPTKDGGLLAERGTYSGDGVSISRVDDRGVTYYKFDPAAAGVDPAPHTITYTFSENACQSTCTFIISVTPAVVISGCPGAIVTVNTGVGNSSCSQVATWDPITATSCYNPVTLVASHNSGDTFPVGDTVVTYTFTNTNGNSGTCTFTVRVIDNTLPVVVTQPLTVQLNDEGTVSITAADVNNGSHDNCGIQSRSIAPTTFNCTNIGANTVILTVTDIHGNQNTGEAIVTVEDVTAPVINGMPIDRTVVLAASSCTKQVGWTKPTAADACGMLSLVSDNADYEEFGSTSLGAGVHTIKYTATDVNGNKSYASFIITVEDNIPPTITGCPVVAPVNAVAGTCGARVFYLAPTASDNCTGVSLTINNTDYLSGNIFPVGTTPVIYTAKDASGNEVTCTINVTVNDVEKPTIATLAGISVNADSGVCTYASTQLTPPSASDICSTVSVVASPASLVLGANTVTWTATDTSGNFETSTQIVTVLDNQKPTIETLPDINVDADLGVCTYASSQLTPPTASDVCSSVNVVASPSSLALGANTVTWTATDGSGNFETSTQIVTVVDMQDPTFDTLADISVNADSGVCTYESSQLTVPSAADNCSVVSVVASPESLGLGANIVTWTATDANGNTATSTQNVTVIDNQDPTIVAPIAISVNADGDLCTASGVALGIPTITTDNCSVQSVTNDAIEPFEPGDTTVTWTITDGSGNTATATQIVTVIDSQDPTIDPIADINVEADSGVCTYASSQLIKPNTIDNCSVVSVEPSSESLILGENIITWTVTDANGNTATSTQIVTVVDTQNPTFDILADISVDADSGVCTYASSQLTVPSAVDNCSVLSVVAPPESLALGVNTVTWTATDVNGNTATSTQNVTVIDNQDPTIVAPIAIL